MRFRLILSLLVVGGLVSCSDFPEQGFATRALGGPHGYLIRDTLTRDTNFRGDTIAPLQPEAPPAASAAPVGICAQSAQQRAQDASQQGFDADVRKHVYDQTLSDCEAWSSLHTIH